MENMENVVSWFPWNAAQELIEVVTALRNANDALIDATTSGDVIEATRLLQDVAVLERRRNRLVHKSNPDVARDYVVVSSPRSLCGIR